MKMTVTTEDGGRQNMFAKEPQIAVMEGETSYIEAAEKANGRWAMRYQRFVHITLGRIFSLNTWITSL